MPVEELVGRLPRPFTFLVGKGGVGKSTTAVDLALALARAGRRTHLISTDPAHSLGDLVPSELPRGLSVEELDTRVRGTAWLAWLADGASELAHAGTYLDAADVASLIEPALVGLDEVISAVRLGELSEQLAPRGELERVVVDTAPMTHALRLLDAGRLLEGWIDALDAMAAKAGAVQEALLRRRVHLRGEDVVDELRSEVERFTASVLPSADFVVVSRGEPLVHAETARLIESLEHRGCRVAVRVEIEPERSPERWQERPPAAGTKDDLVERLLSRDILLFAGKGGVGKSTCAAACAVALAERRPVRLVGAAPVGYPSDLAAAGVELRHIDAEGEFERVRERFRAEAGAAFRRLGLDRSAELDRRVVESLLGLAPPGMDEIFALRALVEGSRAVRESSAEGSAGEERATEGTAVERTPTEGPVAEASARPLVIVDAAPTGHFLRLLEVPDPALAWAHAAMRLILKYRAVLQADGFARNVLDFARGLRSLMEWMKDPRRAGVVLVTLDEPVVQAETARLHASLEERGIPIALVLRNRHRTEATTPRGRGGRHRLPGGRHSSPEALAPEHAALSHDPGSLSDFFSTWRWYE